MRWMVVALVGCGDPGPAGHAQAQIAESSTTDTSQTDATDPAISGLAWFDANGDEVPGVFYAGDQLAYIDGANVAWTLDPWSPEPDSALDTFWDVNDSERLFSDSDCTVEWAQARFPPGFVGGLSDGSLIVMGNDEPISRLDHGYLGDGSSCGDIGPVEGVPMSSMVAVERPAISWTPPLHLELR